MPTSCIDDILIDSKLYPDFVKIDPRLYLECAQIVSRELDAQGMARYYLECVYIYSRINLDPI